MLDKGAESVKICALLDKPERRIVPVRADYTGFTVPDEFIVGYGAARHVLAQNNNMNDSGYPALVFGIFFAEIALLCHAWLIVYTFIKAGIIIPQLSVILTIFAFMAERIYRSVEERDGNFKFKEVAVPIIFSIIVLAVIIIGFSQPIFNV
jgi:hypothetical protein